MHRKWTLLILTFSLSTVNAQLPERPNAKDQNGEKQGEWIYYFTAKWKKTKKLEKASYYRLISYRNSRPTGRIIDFFRSGQKQMQADSLLEEDPAKYHGKVLAFSEAGYVNQINVYQNGELDTAKTIETFHFYIQRYKKEIPEHLDLAYLANDLAFLYAAQKKYDLAASPYMLAKNIRGKQLGTNHIQCGVSVFKLAYALYKQQKHNAALPLFEEAAQVFLMNGGKKNSNYKKAIRYIASINEYKNQ